MSRAVRNVFGIVALVISGYFFGAVNMLAFINQPAWPIKTIIVVIFAVPAIVFLLVGVLCRGFDKIRRDLGIVLLSVAGMTALSILSLVCMLATPDIAKSLPPDFTKMFGAVFSGFACLAIYIVVGMGLLLTSRDRA